MNGLKFFTCFLLVANAAFSQTYFDKVAHFRYFDCENLLIDVNDNIYVAGQDNTGKILITKTDAAGNFIWSRQIGDSWRLQYLGDMILMNQDKIILLGASYPGATGTYRQLIIAEIDTSGQIGFIKTLGDTISGDVYTPFIVIQLSSTHFGVFSNLQGTVLTNGTVYARFDNTGNLIHAKAANLIAKDAVLLPDNSFLLTDIFSNALFYVDSAFTTGIMTGFNLFSVGGITENKKFVKNNVGEIYLLSESFTGGVIGHINSNLKLDTAYMINDSAMNIMGLIDMKQLSSGHWIALGWRETNHPTNKQFTLMELDEHFSPLSAVLSDTFYYDPFLSYDLGLSNTEQAYFPASKINMAPIGTEAHLISTSIPLSAGCNSNPVFITTAIDSFAEMFSNNMSIFQVFPPTASVNIAHIDVGFSLDDCLINGTTELDSKRNLFYPNPASTSITFTVDGICRIYDILGNEITETIVEEGQEMLLNNLKPGIYFVSLINDGKKNVSRLIVSNK